MDDIERKRMAALFDKEPTNEKEAVANAKDCLDACLQHLGEKAEFILFVKMPHENGTCMNRCATMAFTVSAANRLARYSTLHDVCPTHKTGLFSKLRNIFKRGSK